MFHILHSDQTGSVFVRRNDKKHEIKVDIDQLTPDFLKNAFTLESAPKFMRAESNGQAVPIMSSMVAPNEHYIVKGPANIKKNRQYNRDGMVSELGYFPSLTERLSGVFTKDCTLLVLIDFCPVLSEFLTWSFAY